MQYIGTHKSLEGMLTKGTMVDGSQGRGHPIVYHE